MIRLLPLIFLTLILGSCASGDTLPALTTTTAPASAPPNILLIVADDLGYADLNCYGNPLVVSPHLDELASEGIQFMNGYAPAPVCSPSRAAIQTGLHPARIGITEHLHGYYVDSSKALLPPRIPEGLDLNYETIAEVVGKAGYRTAQVGKWHLGNADYAPSKQGYERTFAGGRYGLPTSFYYPFFRGEPFPDLLARSDTGSYLTDVLTDYSLELMNEWKEQPWLISLNYYAPHVPIEGRKDWVTYYEQLIDSTHTRTFPEVEYAAMVSTIDENVGRLLRTLETLGLEENTLVIFVSDNGGLHVQEVPGFDQHTPPTDNGILRGGKGYVYEGGIRIPVLMRYPRGGDVSGPESVPVVLTDIMPTIRELLGLETGAVDGRSLLPFLRGERRRKRSLYWHFPHYSPQGGTPAAALLRDGEKLYVDYEADSLTVFNLVNYPDESFGEPSVSPALYGEFLDWKKRVGARNAKPFD